ncbi:MAG: hypothetical protein BMS9Abin26_1270 [Gammaproteobacteria bacterium]|nr:MAG: hypothetical protein BMS9Abin26_1270 [Gammaproteobacteria bacterium]
MWRAVSEEHGCDFEVLDIEEDSEASRLVDVLELMAFPALLVDGTVRAVGAFDQQQANAIFGKE